MPASTRSKDSDGQIPIVKGSAKATVTVQGKCPDDPTQCTCPLDNMTATAYVTGRVGPSGEVACELSVTLTTEGSPSGTITIVVTAVDGVTVGLTSQTISAPARGSPSTAGFLFTLLGTLGHIDITLTHGSSTARIPRMTVTAS